MESPEPLRSQVMEPTFFDSAPGFQAWLEANHGSETELLIGFNKAASGLGGLTYAEALDAALCYGWIDGVRKSRDATTYTIRFTPRKPRSIWSNINVARVGELSKLGLMRPAGVAAFERRHPDRTGVYSAEQDGVAFDAESEATFRANAAAWTFFQAQPRSYRRPATWWVVSAKREATRARRLQNLVDESAAGKRLSQFVSPTGASDPPRATH
jgi:uncharacterized protein YdeI (YjbR/CyaY-like superfamily)